MHIVNYILFFFFIKFCSSFTLINKQIRPNFRVINYKLNMGCDYYIDKDLHIYDYNNIVFSHINVHHERGYYWFTPSLDEDEDGYDDEFSEYQKRMLEPMMKPIVIYSKNTFNKLSFEEKYKNIVECQLNLHNKTWDDVNKIIKIEHRYERW
jgi:hypothetical protein